MKWFRKQPAVPTVRPEPWSCRITIDADGWYYVEQVGPLGYWSDFGGPYGSQERAQSDVQVEANRIARVKRSRDRRPV